MSRNPDSNRNSNFSYWEAATAIGGAVLAAGSLYYLFSGDKKSSSTDSKGATVKDSERLSNLKPFLNPRDRQSFYPKPSAPPLPTPAYSFSLTDGMGTTSSTNNTNIPSEYTDCVAKKSRPRSRVIPPRHITNMNALLEDIYVRFISLTDEDFDIHYVVFQSILWKLHTYMQDVDPYYSRYSSDVKYAGSHYDRLRINKPDEFDMDIVIRLPINTSLDPSDPNKSDVVIEPSAPGYVQLKMGVQFCQLPHRDGVDWIINKTAHSWMDGNNYLDRKKFLNWFNSVFDKAFNKFDSYSQGKKAYDVNGVQYILGKSASGPAVTLTIQNASQGMNLSVDLVPALKFPESRWPVAGTYRQIPQQCRKGNWMVVPKENKAVNSRSWRLALHEQERELMHNTKNLRQAIRLLKKLRDVQKMDKIASYYIKTLVYHEVVRRNDSEFWSRNNPATLFKILLERFYEALKNGNLPYFWHPKNNLLSTIDRGLLTGYANIVLKVLNIMNDPMNYKSITKYLLTAGELAAYNEIYSPL